MYEYIVEKHWLPDGALDLCAGCGIIGLDLLFHLKNESNLKIADFDFIEVQQQYELHFWENVRRSAVTNVQCRFLNQNYAHVLESIDRKEYDLIVCNPPYFDKDQGKWPPSELKLRSRFFIDSNLTTLIEFIVRKLTSKGNAFVLIRDQSDHGANLIQAIEIQCLNRLKIERLEDIRGTSLLRFSKP